jgi:hypothetical protein
MGLSQSWRCGVEKSNPGRPARSPSLFQLSYPGWDTVMMIIWYFSGCETWYFTSREEHKLRCFETKVPRMWISEEVWRTWRKLHNEELHDAVFFLPNVGGGQVAHMGEIKCIQSLLGILKGDLIYVHIQSLPCSSLFSQSYFMSLQHDMFRSQQGSSSGVHTVSREIFHCWHTYHAPRTKLIIFIVLKI